MSQYQLSNVGEYGRFYRIIPVMESKKCQKIAVAKKVVTNNTMEIKRFPLQSALPDLSDFEIYNGESD